MLIHESREKRHENLSMASHRHSNFIAKTYFKIINFNIMQDMDNIWIEYIQ